MLVLKAGEAELQIRPELGGAIASWRHGSDEILHPVSDPNLIAQHEIPVAGYPLVPFSNRIGNGRFSFDGQSYKLDENFRGEPHTIHGNGWERAWHVEAQEGARVRLSLAHEPPRDPASQWPFRYRAELDYALREDGLVVVLRVRNTDDKAQPVGLGFHPFFPRAGVELGFSASSVWLAGEDSLPARQVPVEGAFRFEPMRPVGPESIDNNYNGWTRTVFLRWPGRGLALTMTADPLFGHLVVFTPPGKAYIAAEPVSNMTDAINHPDISDQGLVRLEPGAVLEGRIDLTLARL